jgi:hypothetical protein
LPPAIPRKLFLPARFGMGHEPTQFGHAANHSGTGPRCQSEVAPFVRTGRRRALRREHRPARSGTAAGTRESATSGKAGGLREVERPKAAWPFGRQPTRRSQSTTSDLVSLRPRLSRPATRGESRREGFAKDHAPPLPGPLLHFAEEREIIDRPAGIASRRYIPGTVKLRWFSGRAGGFPGDLNNLVAANVSSRHNYPLLINLRRLTSAATYFLKKL